MMLPHWTEFFEYLQNIKGRPSNTLMAYQRDLEIWHDFQATNKDPIHFFTYMREIRALSSRSQARAASSVRTYLKFCETKGLKCIELRSIRQPKFKSALPNPITQEELELLMKACHDESLAITSRNQTTLLMLIGLGLRVTELIDLNVIDFSETDSVIKVRGKGGKERLVPVPLWLQDQLTDFIRNVRPDMGKKSKSAPHSSELADGSILINDRGHRPSRVDIWRWLSHWSAVAGFSEPLSPHRFRHGYATALLDSGADLRAIQMLLGHSDIRTTQIYTSVSHGHLQEAIDEFHPLSGIK